MPVPVGVAADGPDEPLIGKSNVDAGEDADGPVAVHEQNNTGTCGYMAK